MMAMHNNELASQLLELVEKYPKNFMKVIKSKKYAHLHDYIMQCTSMLVDDKCAYTLKTRLFWALNNIQDWNDDKVKCVVCNTPLKDFNVKKLHEGYRKTCCKKCERLLAQLHNEEHMQERHGVSNAFQIDDVAKRLNERKDEIQKKRDESKRKHKTFKTSKKEEDAYQLLYNTFSKDDVIRQHKDSRYPFCCDFYIRSKDMFIECNFSWTHGGHWFDENDDNDLKILSKWKSKCSKYYDNAIETWTVRDVKKRCAAERSKLNYVVFWSFEEMKEFYEKQSSSLK